MNGRDAVELNGFTYRWPLGPIVIVCVDGGGPAYFDRLIALFPEAPSQARLTILGEGPDRGALGAQVEAAGHGALAGRPGDP